MIEVRESLIGSINSKQSLSGELNNAVEYLEPVTQEKIVDPTTEIQEVTPDKEYTGLSKVIVNPVTNEIDTNITPENIKKDVNILGVTGEIEELRATELTINPTTEEQVINPEEPNNSFSKVTVNKVTSEIDANIKPENIKEGVDILGVSGNVKELNGEELTINKNGEYTPTKPMNAYTKVIADVPNDTSDATATAGDIATGKTAYISSGLVEGTGTISTPIEKGLVINSYDSDGYPTDISLVNITEVPDYLFYYSFYEAGTRKGIFSQAGASFSLPDNVTSIGHSSFYGCSNLVLNKLPDSLVHLDGYSFHSCDKLNIKSIPAGVTEIPSYCFRSSKSLTELTILGDITAIGTRAFEADTYFAKLVLPNVTSVPTIASNSLGSTLIESGTGYIYVPDSLVDSFKSATNWSKFADQIKGVSEL